MKITLENICKAYTIPGSGNRREVLDDVSLNINSGDSLSIIGPSGSGKSTLLNIIGTLDLPDSGKISLDERSYTDYTENQLADFRNKNVGFVFQTHHLLPQLNLLENVLLPTIPMKVKSNKNKLVEHAMDLLKEVGLSERTGQHPGQMSVGECQRAAVVRALINEPGLILADEPTGSLDQESAESLGDLLVKINQEHNVSMIVVTHDLNIANKMKLIYRLENGKLIH